MNISLHAIRNKEFSAKVETLTSQTAVLQIKVGEAEVNIFLHDGKEEKALTDLCEAVRAYQTSQEVD